MPIIPLYGHRELRARLQEALRRGTLPQSLLLHGEAGIGKQRLALWLAANLVCENAERPCGACRHCKMAGALTHPDITWVFPRPRLKDSDPSLDDVKGDVIDGALERVKAHGLYAAPSGAEGIFVPTIRMLVRGASVTPALAARRVIVIGDAERMVAQEGSDQAANAFLKLLEEPHANTFLILTSSTPGALLPTIRSRMVAVRVAPLPTRDVLEWLDDPLVLSRLKTESIPADRDQRASLAGGAPGKLLGANQAADVVEAARRFVDSAQAGDSERASRLALSQGSAGARGAFSDLLEAIEAELRSRMLAAANAGNGDLAAGASRAIELVEDAKAMASGNVNPQLISWSLLSSLNRELSVRSTG